MAATTVLLLGFQTFVIPLFVILFYSWLRKKWNESVERRKEINRILEAVSRETDLAFSPLPTQRFRELEVKMELPRRGQCAVCLSPTNTRCAKCKSVHYCSGKCQIIHWRAGHKNECRSLPLPKKNPPSFDEPSFDEVAKEPKGVSDGKRENSLAPRRSSSKEKKSIPLIPTVAIGEPSANANHGNKDFKSKGFDSDCPHESIKITKKSTSKAQQPKSSKLNFKSPLSVSSTRNSQTTFPYKLFVELYLFSDDLYPFGLINCGNSCYANAVLQCLAFTPPLTAYLLRGIHSSACRRKHWCFVCELEFLVVRGGGGESPLSPIEILSKVENFGNHLARGNEEDAHEFLRYAVDTMQSVFLREAESLAYPVEETTLIGLTFGGFLRSKITCLRCDWDSERLERMMDLIVEVDGGIKTLEDALTQFTAMEILDGPNKYYCNKCKSYVKARKNLCILEAPNILTVVLKRFHSGNLTKHFKAVKFPEVLNLSPYIKGRNDRSPIYNLYAVVVHRGHTNSTSTGHYLCYVKNAGGVWFGINDSAVIPVDTERVLLEEAYILLYSRHTLRDAPLIRAESSPSKVDGDEWRFCRTQRCSAVDSSSESSSIFSISDASTCSTASTKEDFCNENGTLLCRRVESCDVLDGESESLRKRDTWRSPVKGR